MIPPALLLFQLLAFQLPAAPPEDLTRKITALDTAIFAAYNSCDLDTFSSFLAEDLEFYHDESGLTVGRPAIVQAIRNNICGKVHRELISRTLAVYPLKGYGAVETGIHLFCDPKSLTPAGKCPDGSGVARFTHLWRNQDGAWKITRVISYDHCSGCSTSIAPDYRVAPPK